MRLAIFKWPAIAFLAFAVGSLVWDEVSQQRGRAQGLADAQRDLRAGRIGAKGFGKPMYWQGKYSALLADHFGVVYEHVAGCVPRPYDFGYTAAYNDVMKPAWEARKVDFNLTQSEAKSLMDAGAEDH